jgi:hypothetical protein
VLSDGTLARAAVPSGASTGMGSWQDICFISMINIYIRVN